MMKTRGDAMTVEKTIFNEPHYRFTVEQLYIYNPGDRHYEAKRDLGIDPDNSWFLHYSFVNEDDAFDCFRDQIDYSVWSDSIGIMTAFRVRDTQTDTVLIAKGLPKR